LGAREIAQEGGEILPKVSPKLKAKFGENTTCNAEKIRKKKFLGESTQ